MKIRCLDAAAALVASASAFSFRRQPQRKFGTKTSANMATTDKATQEWDVGRYQDQHSFVWKYGSSLVDLVEFDAKEGKKLTVLDIGCGSGELTRQIAGIVGVAEVVGIDLDRNMIDKANEEQLSQGETNIKFQVGDIRSYRCNLHFDVVFSNAALHWIPPQDMERAVKSIADSLAPQGQLVLEMGGKGNVASIIEATQQAIPSSKSPWCFPSVGEMASLLEKYNVEVTSAQLFDRPTPLEDGKEGVSNWLRMFGVAFFEGMDNDDVEKALVKINEILVSTKPDLFDGNCWMADYRRLRIVAKKTK